MDRLFRHSVFILLSLGLYNYFCIIYGPSFDGLFPSPALSFIPYPAPRLSPSSSRTPSRVVVNKNVEWFGASGTWVVYLGIVFAAWLLILNLVSIQLSWTVTHTVHSIITLYLFHWIKGTPGLDEHDAYRDVTFWEQLDQGMQGTWNRKFLTVVPFVLFLLATHTADYKKQPVILNVAATIVAILPKLPGMSGVRLLGINKY
jgi:hypothetical protein